MGGFASCLKKQDARAAQERTLADLGAGRKVVGFLGERFRMGRTSEAANTLDLKGFARAVGIDTTATSTPFAWEIFLTMDLHGVGSIGFLQFVHGLANLANVPKMDFLFRVLTGGGKGNKVPQRKLVSLLRKINDAIPVGEDNSGKREKLRGLLDAFVESGEQIANERDLKQMQYRTAVLWKPLYTMYDLLSLYIDCADRIQGAVSPEGDEKRRALMRDLAEKEAGMLKAAAFTLPADTPGKVGMGKRAKSVKFSTPAPGGGEPPASPLPGSPSSTASYSSSPGSAMPRNASSQSLSSTESGDSPRSVLSRATTGRRKDGRSTVGRGRQSKLSAVENPVQAW